ncbi:hypothetical protein PVAG01_05448 [Phlyctema vagabunda]|uniref:Zn(2)-C6 fungal-type domain-containing protein n=1 Tax=Phlyctema vagabunda TaxID=108571 RepID=A0ABR4PK39_9HELO
MNTSVAAAPVAKTCEPCAKAKIRCTKKDASSLTCERCDRLKKDCTYRLARRRNNGTRKDKRIEALEAKFNQLLEAQKAPHSRSVSPLSPGFVAEDSASAESSTQVQYGSIANSTGLGTVPERLPSSINVDPAISMDVIGSGRLSVETAGRLLDTFRTIMTIHFPFVVVDPSTSVEELRAKRPFLLLAILAAASFDQIDLQNALQDEVKQAICTRVILKGEVSLDLLQGLLVNIAWCQYQSKPRMFTQFMGLATSMIVFLRLDQPPQKQSWKIPLNFTANKFQETSQRVVICDLDEHRAVAGCFYLSSGTSMILQKTSIFPYSDYITETCCDHISAKGTSPLDKYILYLVQLQRISEKIDQLYYRHGPHLNDPDASVELLISSLQSELSIYRDRLPFDINENYLLKLQYHASELHLYQLALNPHAQLNERSRTRWQWQLKIIRLGLQAAKDFFDCHFTIPIRAQLYFSNTQWIQLGFSLLVSTRLCVLAASDRFSQETDGLRYSLDMSGILKRLIIRLQSLKGVPRGANGDDHLLSKFEERGLIVQKWFDEHSVPKPAPPVNIVGSGSETYQGMDQYVSQQFDGLSNLDQSISSMAPQLAAGSIYDMGAVNYFPDTMDGLMEEVSNCASYSN